VFVPAEHGAGEDAWSRERRADRVVADIARIVARVEQELAQARKTKDVVRVGCHSDQLIRLRATERTARDERSALRTAMFDGEGEAEWNALLESARRARALEADSRSCVGEEVAYAERKVTISTVSDDADALKEQTFRSHARLELSKDTVLADTRKSADKPAAIAAKQPAPPPTLTPPSTGQVHAVQAPHDPAMLIRTADLTLGVYEVEKTLNAVERTARRHGGYLSLRSDRRVTVRVPRERFEETLAKIEKLGDVVHRNVSAEDVTDQFVDLELRLKNALAVRTRLEKLLEGATVKDAVEIHKELAKVTDEIERFQGKLKLLRDRIAYSTITVALEPTEPTRLRQQALLPFPWMNVLGLSPLLQVNR
jgi:hypothetical protein